MTNIEVTTARRGLMRRLAAILTLAVTLLAAAATPANAGYDYDSIHAWDGDLIYTRVYGNADGIAPHGDNNWSHVTFGQHVQIKSYSTSAYTCNMTGWATVTDTHTGTTWDTPHVKQSCLNALLWTQKDTWYSVDATFLDSDTSADRFQGHMCFLLTFRNSDYTYGGCMDGATFSA